MAAAGGRAKIAARSPRHANWPGRGCAANGAACRLRRQKVGWGAPLEEPPGYVLPRQTSEPSICRLVEYWRSKCVEGRLPVRADIDPVALPYILANIFLLDVLPEEQPCRRFRFRLFGTELVRVYGRNLTGRTFHDALEPGPADGAVRHATRVVQERIPLFVAGKTLHVKNKEWLDFENCMLPLQDKGGAVNMILGATVYTMPPWRGSGSADR